MEFENMDREGSYLCVVRVSCLINFLYWMDNVRRFIGYTIAIQVN